MDKKLLLITIKYSLINLWRKQNVVTKLGKNRRYGDPQNL